MAVLLRRAICAGPVMLRQRASPLRGVPGGWEHMRRKRSSLVGQVPYSVGGRRSRRLGPLHSRHVDFEQVWRKVPVGHVHYQHYRRISHRRPNDAVNRAIPATPELAALPGRRRPGRVHDLLQLRVRNISGRSVWRTLGRTVLYGRECVVRLSGRVVRHGCCEWPLIGLEAEC